MASGKITVTNNSTMTLNVNILGNGQTQGGPVASGTLVPNQPSGFIVSGYALYQVQIWPPNGGVFFGPSVAADTQVEFIVSSDSGVTADE